MARHGVQQHRHAVRVALAAAGDEREERRRIDVREVELPRDDARDRVERCSGRLRAPVRPEERNPDRAGVEAEGVSADDVPVDASVAPLVDRAEAVDEKVVADVVPAVPLDVEQLDAPHDRRRLRPRVVVLARRVMDDRESDRRRIARRSTSDRLVRVPACPRYERRLPGQGHRRRSAVGNTNLGAPDEARPNARDAADASGLDPVRVPDPPGVADAPARVPAALGRGRVGCVLRLRLRGTPWPPAPARRAHPEPHRSAAAPSDSGEREPPDRVAYDEPPVAHRSQLDARHVRVARGEGRPRAEQGHREQYGKDEERAHG